MCGRGLTEGRVLQVLRGCEDSELRELHLQRNPALYSFTRQGAGLSVSRRRAPRALGRPRPWALAVSGFSRALLDGHSVPGVRA